MFIAASAFEAWEEHVVTVKQIVADKLFCPRLKLLKQVFYHFWREVHYILLQRQDAEARAVNYRKASDGWDGCLS